MCTWLGDVSATDAGRTLAQEAVVIVEGVDRRFFGPLGRDQKVLMALFERMRGERDEKA